MMLNLRTCGENTGTILRRFLFFAQGPPFSGIGQPAPMIDGASLNEGG